MGNNKNKITILLWVGLAASSTTLKK